MAHVIYDNFAGSIIDTGKWNVLQTGPGSVTQNNKLIIDGDANWGHNFAISTQSFSRASMQSVSFKAIMPTNGGNNGHLAFGLTPFPDGFGPTEVGGDQNLLTTIFWVFATDSRNFLVIDALGNMSGIHNTAGTHDWEFDTEYTFTYQYASTPNVGFNIYVSGGIWAIPTLIYTTSTPMTLRYGNPLVDPLHIGMQSYFSSSPGWITEVSYDTLSVPTTSHFGTPTAVDGTVVTSFVDSSNLVGTIQAYDSDPYFDATSKLARVWVYYTHEAGRQSHKIIHKTDGTNMSGVVSWAPGAHDGTWQKTSIKAFDANNAVVELPRSAIGSVEDITHSDGTMNLNT